MLVASSTTYTEFVLQSRLLTKISLALFGTLLALGLAELSVRLLNLDPEIVHVEKGRYRLSLNEKIGYEPVPNLQYDGKSLRYFDYRGGTNTLGYRDRDHSVPKAEGTNRIVVIGDSVTAGQSVKSNADVFPQIVEQLLSFSGTTYEVINFGVSGYNTEQEVETLRVKGLDYDPDTVLVAYCLNDRERNDGGMLRALLADAKGKVMEAPEQSWFHRFALYRLIYYRVLKRHSIRPSEYDSLSVDTVAASFVELRKLATANGFEVAVAVFPDLKMLDDYTRQSEHDSVRTLAVENGFQLIDLLPAFQRCGGGIAHDRYHPTAKGHRCAAGAIASALDPGLKIENRR